MTSPQNPWQQGPNPQQFAPQPGYPQQARFGHPQQPSGAKPPAPGTLKFASIVGLVIPPLSAVLSVLTLVLLLVEIGEYALSSWSFMVFQGGFTFAAVVCAALWIVFSLQLSRGRGWARIGLVVLAALWLLYDLYSIINFTVILTQYGMAMISAVAIIGMFQMFLAFVTPVLVTILVFLKPSNDYIKLMAGR
ncbi:proline-rich domain-containing protein [Saccharopolyspora sp. NPDC050389]|uniref:proline-rich domain-containing protein n=1 Tax=Saccharopolyspora sp. NPDC050389 TaxID=3155516 RepID=UPI0033D54E7F